MHKNHVKPDNALLNVLRAWRKECGLIWQAEEGYVVYEEHEFAILYIIVKRELPLQLVILQFQREQAGVG